LSNDDERHQRRGWVGSHIARAAIASGYEDVIANARASETLKNLIDELGPRAPG
jgi:hypothetical protein